MNCKTARALFSEHMDGALGASKREALEAHLKACDGCKGELKELLAAHAAVKTLPRHKAPGGFAERVMARLPSEAAPAEGQGLFGWLWSMPFHLKLAEAAAIITVAVVGVYSAGFLSGRLLGNNAAVTVAEDNIMASVSLEYLDPIPPESMGDFYLSKENGNEQQAD